MLILSLLSIEPQGKSHKFVRNQLDINNTINHTHINVNCRHWPIAYLTERKIETEFKQNIFFDLLPNFNC